MLVVLVLSLIHILFDDQNISKTLFQRSINQFEENVSTKQAIDEQYVTLQDNQDNRVSNVLKTMSQGCIKVIQYIVLIFSDFISMILMIVIY